MNRNIILTAILLLFFSTWSNPALTYASFNKAPDGYSKSAVASSNTIWVPDNYTTIQQAINAAEEGETIFIRARTYYERVIVDKAVSLVGENKYDTIIDGSKTDPVVIVMANNVAISNVTIQNGEFGIWLLNSHNNILTDNILTNNTDGINLWGSSNNVLTGNIASNNYHGIYLFRSSGNTVSGNIASNNFYGIRLDGSSGNTVSGNNVSNNRHGIYLDGSSYNTLIDNLVSSNTDDGIRLYHSDNSVLSGNTASNNTYGFYIGDSDNSVLSDNKALNNQHGIYLHYSRNNILTGNTVANNSQYGIFLDSSSNNEILHNNFINNVGSSRSIDSVNSWDNSVEGNYWSDYHDTDANQDGIADTPYFIEENNQDNYPLMAMFLQFDILIENRAYIINTISNSTISELQYHSNLYNRTNAVSFKVNGAGFCRISIPHSLIDPPFTVSVDGNPPLYFKKLYANGTHTWLYFAYDPSEHEITIMHTFPSEQLLFFQWTVFGLAIIIVILFSISVNYYRLFNKQKKVIEAYEREVGSFPVSREERARIRFIKDVIEREEKIEKFKRKYGIRIQPASTLEDLMEKLGVQKES